MIELVHNAVTLDAIVLDDDSQLCEIIKDMFAQFYRAGEVHTFTDFDEAVKFCMERPQLVALFVLDVYLGGHTAFDFIKAIEDKYPLAADDSIIITGNANENVVNDCMEARVNHLLEKPVRLYAFQFAAQAIISKYERFAARLLKDPEFTRQIIPLDEDIFIPRVKPIIE